jgi:type I restriction enzyme S subunit
MLIPREGKIYDGYFRWLFKSKSYIKALQGTSDLVRDGQALRYANFSKVSLPEITIEEQKEIADFIEAKVAEIDGAIPVLEKCIDLLKEYRTRLISDVVTGQIDVRDVVIPDYEPEENGESEEPENEKSDAEESTEA